MGPVTLYSDLAMYNDSPLTFGASTAVSIGEIVAGTLKGLAVKGSRPRYVLASTQRALLIAWIGSETVRCAASLMIGNPLGAVLWGALHLFAALWLGRDLKRIDEDDFWSDTSKKLKRRLKSLTTGRRRPAYAGTGA